ncbi:MAG: hypothetical protein HFI94_06365 [Lachnospiraceae bacterium]|nr:hypothetical protein [Lachnospiraceae bacterium]
MSLAVWEDYHTKKISNLLIFTALISAVIYQIRCTGYHGILYSFFHAGLTIVLLFPLYLFHVLGAGDIKVFGVTAVFLSWQLALLSFLWSLYLSLIPITFLLFSEKKVSGGKIAMAGPIAGGILIVLYKEGCI